MQWSYPKNNVIIIRDRSRVALNGIALTAQAYQTQDLGGGLHLSLPDVSVFDPDGRLGVTLDRSGLTDGLPFEGELFEDVTRELIARLLLLPEANVTRRFEHPGILHWLTLARSKYGYSVVHPAFLQNQSWRALMVSGPFHSEWTEIVNMLPRTLNSCVIHDFYANSKAQEYVALNRDRNRWADGLRVTRGRVFLHDAVRKKWPNNRNSRKWTKVTPEWKGSSWISLVNGEFEEPLVKPDLLEAALEKGGASLAVEYRIDGISSPAPERQSLWTLVQRYFGVSPWIPYALNHRRRHFAKAFKELKSYMNIGVEPDSSKNPGRTTV